MLSTPPQHEFPDGHQCRHSEAFASCIKEKTSECVCGCARQVLTKYNPNTKPKSSPFISERWLSARVFVHRLRICHHMTFRSCRVYLANPRGALTAPADVMDDAVCTESGLSTKCALYCSVQTEKRGGCDIASLAADSPGRLFFSKKKTLKEGRTFIVQSLHLFPASAFTLPPSICNDPRRAIACNVSGSSTTPWETGD